MFDSWRSSKVNFQMQLLMISTIRIWDKSQTNYLEKNQFLSIALAGVRECKAGRIYLDLNGYTQFYLLQGGLRLVQMIFR